MKYENINYLYLLPIVFIMALAYIVFYKNRQNAIKMFVRAELMDSIVASVSRKKQKIKATPQRMLNSKRFEVPTVLLPMELYIVYVVHL